MFEFHWPDWVPDKTRKEVSAHWAGPDGAQHWQQQASLIKSPFLGDRGTFTAVANPVWKLSGRYIHLWGEFGCVVTDDGMTYPVLPPVVDVRVLALDQPYASAIALGMKRFETRNRRMNHREKLFVHANKKAPSYAAIDIWHEALQLSGVTCPDELNPQLALGRVVASTTVMDCLRMTDDEDQSELPGAINIGQQTELETLLGHWAKDRYAIALVDVFPLSSPLPWKGNQTLQRASQELVYGVRQQVEAHA